LKKMAYCSNAWEVCRDIMKAMIEVFEKTQEERGKNMNRSPRFLDSAMLTSTDHFGK